MSLSAILEAMVNAGTTPEAMLAVARAHEASQSDALAKRRAADAERQQRKRDRANGIESHVTSRDVTVTVPSRTSAGDAGGNTKPLTEVSYTPVSSNELTAPKGPKREDRGSRLPDDWRLSASDEKAALEAGLTVQQAQTEADKFRDYWRAVPGAKGRKLDWSATWRNWCRSAAERLPRNQQANHERSDRRQAPLNGREASRGVWAEVLAEHASEGSG